MDVPQIAPSRTKRTLRKLIRGVEYLYDRELDIIHSGPLSLGAEYDRTQVDQPVDLCVELTTHCNFICENCFSDSARGAGGVHANADLVYREIEESAGDLIRVCITGGEPLLHPRAADILRLPSTARDVGFVLSTNGTARPDLESLLIEQDWLVAISLHGREAAHNAYTDSQSFTRVVRRVEALARTNIVHLYCVLSDYMTAADIAWLHAFRDSVGVSFLRFVVPRPRGRYRMLTSEALVRHAYDRADARSGVKTGPSITAFISATQVRRRTS